MLTAEALVDLDGATGDERAALLRRRRQRVVTLEDPELGVAVVRDQQPLTSPGRCSPGTPTRSGSAA